MNRWISVAPLLCAVSLSLAQGGSKPASPRLLTPGEFAAARGALQPGMVPNLRSPLQPDPKQAFLIPGSGGHTLQMIPVRYDSYTPAADNTADRCGIFFLQQGKAPVFVPTLGYDFTETLFCGGLKAAGFLPSASPFPRLLLVYQGATGHDAGAAPMVLDFSAAKGAYLPNEAVSQQLDNNSAPATIAGMKAALRGHNP